MSEWVLVPVEFDDQTYEGIWTEAYNEWAEFGSTDKDAGRAAVVAMLAARPPIPRAVWDAMVERGARAMTLRWQLFIPQMDAALRAALGNPRVEGDTP